MFTKCITLHTHNIYIFGYFSYFICFHDTCSRVAAGHFFFFCSFSLLCVCLIICGWWTSGRLPGDCYSLSVAMKSWSVDEVRLTFLSGPLQGVCKDPEPIQTGSEIKSLLLLLPPLTGFINYLASAWVNQKGWGNLILLAPLASQTFGISLYKDTVRSGVVADVFLTIMSLDFYIKNKIKGLWVVSLNKAHLLK